ncbi:MAG TPA: FecR family protein [bacterium]|nr:FecR family protein [bacterium]
MNPLFKRGVFLSLVIALVLPTQSRSQEIATGPESVQYVIEDIHGSDVQVLEDGQKKWESAEEGQVVESGDEIKVGARSEATLMLGTDTSAHLDENSDMKVSQIAANETGGFLSRLEIFAGRVLADVKKNLTETHSTFEIESNGVVCGVRGTAFEVANVGGEYQVSTHEGKVEVSSGGEIHTVTAGNFSSFRNGKFSSSRRLERPEIARFQKWRAFRQVVWKKRLKRLEDIRNHRRQPWLRKHPHLRRELKLKKRKWLRRERK